MDVFLLLPVRDICRNQCFFEFVVLPDEFVCPARKRACSFQNFVHTGLAAHQTDPLYHALKEKDLFTDSFRSVKGVKRSRHIEVSGKSPRINAIVIDKRYDRSVHSAPHG